MIAAILGWLWSRPIIRNLIIVAAILGGLFVWHKVDKSSAVRRAVVEYVADVELTTSRVQLEELKRRQALTSKANRHLQNEIEKANADAEAATQELEHYVSTVDDNCTLLPPVIDRLRNR
ncbi:hypothetical protein [Roseibium sp.]|uniref:hypothetical protein n=1 Tax=Roseibium sp. TaxID=1936156 RepID=UPI001B2B38B6|nr:hypothetical protein [Roseibium sp.]MBO6858492.1 hypothetical protein [Roseibium sp.]